MDLKSSSDSQPHIELHVLDASVLCIETQHDKQQCKRPLIVLIHHILTKFHGGYFRISLSLCSQALLWKTIITLQQPTDHDDQSLQLHPLRKMLLPATAFTLLWPLAIVTVILSSLLYLLKCVFNFDKVKAEFMHHVGVNYLFAPWISCLLLLESSPYNFDSLSPKKEYLVIIWWVCVIPIVILDIKIYGQWFTKGKRYNLSRVANPTSQLSVVANLVGARGAIHTMGWKEVALCLFSTAMAHYLVLFVTLYQRLPGSDGRMPMMLRPVFFLFVATPSMASLAWGSINGSFDTFSKMLFFLSLFTFMSLACRPMLFWKSMRRFSVAWWAYSFPLTILALASTEYRQVVEGHLPHALMLLLSMISILVFFVLVITTAVVHKL
ncbi:hypothetical protein Dimus_009676 [Dionaea muscipula]